MSDFWKDMLENNPSDTELPDILRELASAMPQYQEMDRYLMRGMEHVVEVYANGAGDIYETPDDEPKMKTGEGTSHCAIVDSAMMETLTDDMMLDFLKALKKFEGDQEPMGVFEEFRKLLHFEVHIGMCIGIGMGLEDGTLKRTK